jgi:hypothetical protein
MSPRWFDVVMNPSDPIPPTTDIDRSPNDDAIESLLVSLFGRLEQQMTALQPTDSVKQMTRMIETALSMLVTIIDTGVEHYDVSFFSSELPSVWRLRERSKVVLDVLDRESWSTMFGMNSKAKHPTVVMHRNLGKNFAQMFRDLFARFSEEFQSPQLREEWGESSHVLIEDFVQRW